MPEAPMKISIKKYLVLALFALYPAALCSMEISFSGWKIYFRGKSPGEIRQWCFDYPHHPAWNTAQEVLAENNSYWTTPISGSLEPAIAGSGSVINWRLHFEVQNPERLQEWCANNRQHPEWNTAQEVLKVRLHYIKLQENEEAKKLAANLFYKKHPILTGVAVVVALDAGQATVRTFWSSQARQEFYDAKGIKAKLSLMGNKLMMVKAVRSVFSKKR